MVSVKSTTIASTTKDLLQQQTSSTSLKSSLCILHPSIETSSSSHLPQQPLATSNHSMSNAFAMQTSEELETRRIDNLKTTNNGIIEGQPDEFFETYGFQNIDNQGTIPRTARDQGPFACEPCH